MIHTATIKVSTGALSVAVEPRQRIVTGARRHFLAHGFRNVTMDDLAKELGMSKKTLYAHFESKRVLLEAVLHDKFQQMAAELERITAKVANDFMATLQQLLSCIERHSQEIQPAFVRDVYREDPAIFQLVEQFRHDAIQLHFGRVFSTGRKRGLIRKDIPLQVLIEILLGATQAVVNPAKVDGLGLTPDKGYRAVISVVLEGALVKHHRTEKG